MDFENKLYKGIYYSRFIASWINEGGKPNSKMKYWLMSLKIDNEPIPNEIIKEIMELATNGKMELETSAREFLNK